MPTDPRHETPCAAVGYVRRSNDDESGFGLDV